MVESHSFEPRQRVVDAFEREGFRVGRRRAASALSPVRCSPGSIASARRVAWCPGNGGHRLMKILSGHRDLSSLISRPPPSCSRPGPSGQPAHAGEQRAAWPPVGVRRHCRRRPNRGCGTNLDRARQHGRASSGGRSSWALLVKGGRYQEDGGRNQMATA